MAIRERLRRVLSKPSSSDLPSSPTGSMSQTESNNQSSGAGVSSTSSSNKSGGSPFPWKRSSKEKEERKEDKEDKKRERRRRRTTGIVHPRDKPLTASNMRHQEMLSGFDFTFGSSPNRLSQVVPDGFEGISPCCTRTPSLCAPEDSPYDTPSPATISSQDLDV